MKIFISSVRRGLEDERDALAPLIQALGHEALRFEDFTAQPVASRAACLTGVEAADAYLLLLASVYGDPVFDTGLSPTEEEWNVARRRGLPIIVFRKRDVAMDPKQQDFVRRVEEYTSGRFRRTFATAIDLQPQVAAAIGELAAEPPALRWETLGTPADVPWLHDFGDVRHAVAGPATLECHLTAVEPRRRLLARDLESLPAALARAGREHSLFEPGEGLDVGVDDNSAWAAAADHRSSRRRGLRVYRNGTVTIWTELPGDGLGQIFDRDDVSGRLRAALVAASHVGPDTSERVAPAVGVAPIQLLAQGRVDDLGRRSSATFGSPSQNLVRVEADETIPRAALPAAADEIAQELTARLVQQFRSARSW